MPLAAQFTHCTIMPLAAQFTHCTIMPLADKFPHCTIKKEAILLDSLFNNFQSKNYSGFFLAE
jgi:hypothetical protein